MTITTTAQISATIFWAQTQTENELTQFSDIGSVAFDRDLFTGTGNNQVNHLWHDTQTLDAGGTNLVDTFSLSRTVVNDTINMSYSGGNIKAIALANYSSITGATIDIVATGNNAMSGVFSYGSGIMVYPSSSMLIYNNPIVGLPIPTDGTQRYLYVRDIGGSGSQYTIAIVGTSG